MTPGDAIARADRVLAAPGTAAPDGKSDPRWQAVIAVSWFVETDPDVVWAFVERWGAHDDPDLRAAIATCLLQPLLEHHAATIRPLAESTAHGPTDGGGLTLRGPLPGELERMRSAAGEFQATFAVPPRRAEEFARTLLADDPSPEPARLVIDAVVFPPRHVNELLGHDDVEAWLDTETAIDAGPARAVDLLTAALSDWTDCWFAPRGGEVLLYADHDEYATLFVHRQPALASLTARLGAAGFHDVPHYVREL